MKARLLCRTGDLSGASFDITDEATVGRGTDNTIVLSAKVISQAHARLAFDSGLNRYVLEDLGSRNGTRVDGLPVQGPVRLGRLHVITFGDRHDFIFLTEGASTPDGAAPGASAGSNTQVDAQVEILVPLGLQGPAGGDLDLRTSVEAAGAIRVPEGLAARPDPAPDTHADEVATELPASLRVATPPANAPRKAAPRKAAPQKAAPQTATPEAPEPPASKTRFVFEIDGAQGRRTAQLMAGRRIVGRSPLCDLVLAEGTLSREHAAFTLEPGHVLVSDLGSQNGTFVAGTRVASETEVAPGTTITLGDVRVVFVQETD